MKEILKDVVGTVVYCCHTTNLSTFLTISNIAGCIEDGGLPQYTVNKSGQLMQYLGCSRT